MRRKRENKKGGCSVSCTMSSINKTIEKNTYSNHSFKTLRKRGGEISPQFSESPNDINNATIPLHLILQP